jgi:hypothetical protein
MPVPVQVVGEGSSELAGKRQSKNSVFDRMEEQGGREEETASVFDRIEEPAEDPAMQGRRAQ